MGFVFSYSLDGTAHSDIKDFPLDTLTNYQNGTGTNGYKRGDAVFFNAGLLRRVNNAAGAKAIGVLEGVEFVGLVAQGQPYAAANASFTASAVDTTKYPNGIGKVRVETDSVYKVPLKAGQTASNANLGVAYGISVDAAGNQSVDTTNVANPVVKIVDYTPDKLSVLCIMSTNNTF